MALFFKMKLTQKYIIKNYGKRCETRDVVDLDNIENARCGVCEAWDKYDMQTKRCLSCHRKLKEEIDPIAKKITGHNFSCVCMPNVFLSIG